MVRTMPAVLKELSTTMQMGSPLGSVRQSSPGAHAVKVDWVGTQGSVVPDETGQKVVETVEVTRHCSDVGAPSAPVVTAAALTAAGAPGGVDVADVTGAAAVAGGGG